MRGCPKRIRTLESRDERAVAKAKPQTVNDNFSSQEGVDFCGEGSVTVAMPR
jgi:hypothetical protein